MAATAEQVLIKALQEFQTSTVNSRLDRYSSTTLHYIQKQIVDIQSDQDKTKTHVNFTRYALFLQTFDQFDRACHAVEINIPGLASYVWASFRLILVVRINTILGNVHVIFANCNHKMAREDVQVLDSILESYQEFGRHLPLLESYHDLLTRHTDTKLCLAWIYQDLLCFHGQLLKLFESNGKLLCRFFLHYGTDRDFRLEEELCPEMERLQRSRIQVTSANSQRSWKVSSATL